jgi:hypothetical protein
MERGEVPEDVTHVRVDSSVRAIKRSAFWMRSQLRIMIFNEELQERLSGGHFGVAHQ